MSSCAGLGFSYVLTCKGQRMAAVRHLKNASRVGAAGQRKEMVSRCALLSTAVCLQPPLYWRPPHRLGTNGPRTAHFVSSAARNCALLWFCVRPERAPEGDPPALIIHQRSAVKSHKALCSYPLRVILCGDPNWVRGPNMGLFDKWGMENQTKSNIYTIEMGWG